MSDDEKWVVTLTRRIELHLTSASIIEAFPSEWQEAQRGGATVDEFVRDSVDIMGWDLEHDPGLADIVDTDCEVECRKLRPVKVTP